MERRTGPDPGLDAEGTAAWDTLSTVAVSLVLLLFCPAAVPAGCPAPAGQPGRPFRRSRFGSGNHRTAPRRRSPGPAAAGLLFQAGAGDLEERSGS